MLRRAFPKGRNSFPKPKKELLNLHGDQVMIKFMNLKQEKKRRKRPRLQGFTSSSIKKKIMCITRSSVTMDHHHFTKSRILSNFTSLFSAISYQIFKTCHPPELENAHFQNQRKFQMKI